MTFATGAIITVTPAEAALHARDNRLCTCGHKSVSHGSYNSHGIPVGVGAGPCGIDRDARNALTSWLGDMCPCERFNDA